MDVSDLRLRLSDRPRLPDFKAFAKTVRGLIYMTGIFSVEYAAGRFLDKKGQCPWSYQKSPWNISHVIRLDFAPAWFLIGLLFEKAVAANDSRT